MSLQVRSALPADAAPACEIVRRSIEELCFEDHRGDAATLSVWLENKTAAGFEAWIRSQRHIARIAELGGRVVGFGLLNIRGSIALLYVSPEEKSRGIGSALLAELEREALRAGIRELTAESTATALGFYRRAGYLPTGESLPGFGVTRRHPVTRCLAAGSGCQGV